MRTRLGRWRIERTLGRDLSGTYHTGHRDDGERATLYVPFEGVAVRRPSLLRLLDQHRGLMHPVLVRFHDIGHDDGEPFLIGDPVDDALGSLRGGARPTAGQAGWIIAELAAALVAAHDRGVAHGGLELDNVLWAAGHPPRVLGTGAAALGLADADILARGDVVALGRLLCVLTAGWASPSEGAAWAAAGRIRELGHQLADPSAGLSMREAHALLIAGEPTQPLRGALQLLPPPDGTVPGAGWDAPPEAPTDGQQTEDHHTKDHHPVTLAAPRGPDELGGRLGRYRILSRLGRGGMGEVLLAEDPTLRRGVAIKRIRPGLEHDRTFRARLRREAQLAARLNHRAIVQVFDLITHDHVDHVVMEYVPGPSLYTLLAGRPMASPEVVRIAAEVADGLSYAHQQQVIHRDLKLENILLDTDGQPKIADFGIARRLTTGHAGRDSLTGHGSLVGTLRAMPPEQLLGEDADARSDLFSFGVLLYELLTGVSPFAASTDVETIHRVVYHRQTQVIDLAPSVPRALSELVDHLLEKAPAQRPTSARALRDRLRDLVDHRPALVMPLPVAVPDLAAPSAGNSVTHAATGSGDYHNWPTPHDAHRPSLLRKQLSSKIQAPFVLAEIRALQASIFKRAPEVQSALAVASKLEHSYDLRRPDLFIPAWDTFCAVLEPFSTTVLTGTLRRIGYEIFPQYISILGIPAAEVRTAMQLQCPSDLVRVICDAYSKCVVGADAGTLSARITGTIATVTDTTFMPCQLQMGVFLGAGKLTGLFCDSVLTEKRCRSRGDPSCVYEFAF